MDVWIQFPWRQRQLSCHKWSCFPQSQLFHIYTRWTTRVNESFNLSELEHSNGLHSSSISASFLSSFFSPQNFLPHFIFFWGNPPSPCQWLGAVGLSPIHLPVGRMFKRLCWSRRKSCLWEQLKDEAALLTCMDWSTSVNAVVEPLERGGLSHEAPWCWCWGSPQRTWWGVILRMETMGGPWPELLSVIDLE